MDNRNLITARNLDKSYFNNNRELHVLKEVNLEIKHGEILAIVGPSGAGKSTLLHILGALDRPTQGEVHFEDKDISRLNDNELSYLRNRNIGFVFQFHHLLPEFTAVENVSIPGFMYLNSRGIEEVKDKAMNVLRQVGLGDRMNHRPSELSGGEQQRLAVARALINDPQIILADEPTGNLDWKNSEVVHNILWELNRNKKQTLVIVTHNEELAGRASRIIHLVDGRII